MTHLKLKDTNFITASYILSQDKLRFKKMTIKNNLALIRRLLYFYAVIENGRINITAERNGIKAANLSKMLTELEEEIGAPLLERSNQGVRPTVLGQKIYLLSKELSQHISALLDQTTEHNMATEVSYCFPENFCLNNLEEFHTRYPDILLFEEKSPRADVIVSYREPPADASKIIVKNNVGSAVTQAVWVCCRQDSEAAVLFAEFINASLHL